MNSDYQNPLIGKKLTGISISDDKMALRFETEDGELVITTDGDCCSHSWFEHVSLPALGFPAIVLSVENISMPGVESDPEAYEVIQTYGIEIKTDKGSITIEYRNSSNGYYGGWVNWPNDDGWHYGGVHGQNISTQSGWAPVVE